MNIDFNLVLTIAAGYFLGSLAVSGAAFVVSAVLFALGFRSDEGARQPGERSEHERRA